MGEFLASLGEGYRALASSPIGLVFVFILGALIGSFLNVVIIRLPEGESIIHPPSHCPRCHDRIPWYLNVPILSWIVLLGRCRRCRLPISIRYPVVELGTALLFLASVTTHGWTLKAVSSAIFAAGLVVVTFVDIDRWEIPDEISIPGIVIGSLLRPFAFHVPWWDGLAAALAGGAVLALIRGVHMWLRGVEGMGLGDVKLIAMIGAFIGPWGLVPCILVASLVGSLVGVVLLAADHWGVEDESPPGPSAPAPEPGGDAPLAPGVPAPEATAAGATAPESAAGATAPDSTAPALAGGVTGEAGETEDEDEDEDEGEGEGEEEWVPPRYAVPFGPFLALGGLSDMLFHPILMRWFNLAAEAVGLGR